MNIVMGWPEWIMVVMVGLGVALRAAKANGLRPADTSSDAFWATSCFTYPAFQFGILYWGGFFS